MQHRGLSQAAVAREVGVADAQVSRWRRGQVTPSVRYLQRIADTFGVPRAQLDRLAGYPSEGGEPPDPQLEAELQAYLARYRDLLERTVPRTLWPAYAEACRALAEELAASFDAALQAAQEPARHTERQIGFHTNDAPNGARDV